MLQKRVLMGLNIMEESHKSYLPGHGEFFVHKRVKKSCMFCYDVEDVNKNVVALLHRKIGFVQLTTGLKL